MGIDQITIFNDVPKAQEWFQLLRSVDSNQEDVINFEEEELVLVELTKLSLVNLRLRGIETLSLPFDRIQYLNLSFNRISELSGLSHLISLKTLDISHNRVVELEPLRNLKDLEIVRCDYNIIETLEPLYDTIKLNQLWLSHNRIRWEELIYLTQLNKLKIINLSDNPLEKKPKIYEFLCSLKPFILFINGISRREFFEQKLTENTDKSGDFFRSPDGKVMLTRARAYFKTSNTSNLNKDRLNKSIKNSTIDFGGELTQAIDLSIHSKSNPNRDKNSNPIRTNKNAKCNDDDYTGSEKGLAQTHGDQNEDNFELRSLLPSITEKNTPLNSHSNTPDKISSTVRNNDNLVDRNSPIIKDDYQSNHVKKGSKNLLKNLYEVKEYDTADNNKDNLKSMCICEGQIIRFGGNDDDLDAIVAFNLNSDKSGYVRWTKSGPIACSLEGGRLLSSYKSGSIAAMLDAAGNGSIMDPKGRCLLVITQENGGVVKILDKSGNNVAVYEKHKIEKQQEQLKGEGQYHVSLSNLPYSISKYIFYKILQPNY
jgi:Leucine-rich repeat (LRR) protein